MKPMSMTQKILSRSSNGQYLEKGEFIVADIDLCFAHDPVIGVLVNRFKKNFGENAKVWDPSKIALFQDHLVPAKNAESARLLSLMDKFVEDQQIEHFFPFGSDYGVCHIKMIEAGLTVPGSTMIGTDSHTVTAGAFNLFAAGVGVFDMVNVFKTGDLWFKVPGTIQVDINGQLPDGVLAKDIILKLVGHLGLDGANGFSLEFTGDTVENLPIEERVTLCNMAVEAGATNGIMALNDETREFLRKKSCSINQEVETDSDYKYDKVIQLRAEDIESQVALPHRPDNVSPISKVRESRIAIQRVYVGGCTGGKQEDIINFAKEIKGQKVAKGVEVHIVPATSEIFKYLAESGLMVELINFGAVVDSPGCKSCYGVHGGVTKDNENCLATINRNFVGRMGNPKSNIYLASPIVASRSAITGYITDTLELV